MFVISSHCILLCTSSVDKSQCKISQNTHTKTENCHYLCLVWLDFYKNPFHCTWICPYIKSFMLLFSQNQADINNKRHYVLSGIFWCIVSGAYPEADRERAFRIISSWNWNPQLQFAEASTINKFRSQLHKRNELVLNLKLPWVIQYQWHILVPGDGYNAFVEWQREDFRGEWEVPVFLY